MLLLILLSLSAQAHTLNVGLGTKGKLEPNYTEQTAFVQSNAFGEHSLLESLKLDYSVKAKINTTSQNYNYNNPDKKDEPSFEFKISKAALVYFVNDFAVSSFILNPNPKLFSRLDSKGHLGLQEEWSLKNSDFQLGITAQQLQLMGYKSSGNSNQLPFFYTEGLWANYENDQFKIFNQVNHFSLLNTSGSLAFESSIYGNSVTGLTAETSNFNHEFRGFSNTTQFVYKRLLKSVDVQTSAQYLLNEAGSNQSRQALLISIGFKYKEFTLGVENFEIGEQTLPAALLNSEERYVNARGNKLFASYLLDKFLITGYYTRFVPIQKNIYQTEAQSFYITVEKSFGDIF